MASQTFLKETKGKHIHTMIDNTTAIGCINKLGTSRNMLYNSSTADIWKWALANNNFLSAAYIPGIDNVVADEESRKQYTDAECMLNKIIFDFAIEYFGIKPDIDLFASRINKQLPIYVAYKPDPNAMATDAFSLKWDDKLFYLFPPLSVMTSCLQKIDQDKTEALLVVLYWKPQVWYPVLLRSLVRPPILSEENKYNLLQPSDPNFVHPLANTMKVMVCHVSGDTIKTLEFRRKLQKLSWDLGGMALNANINDM